VQRHTGEWKNGNGYMNTYIKWGTRNIRVPHLKNLIRREKNE